LDGFKAELHGFPVKRANQRIGPLANSDTQYAIAHAALGHAYAVAGNRREAEKVLQTLSNRARKSYVSPFDVALIYTALGEKDKAFALLDKAVAEHSTFLVYTKWEPRLDPLRSDPRFQDLLKRIGL